MKANHSIWILVADAYVARLYGTQKITQNNWELLKEFAHAEDRNKRDVDLVADKYGSYMNIGTSGSSSYEQPSDPKEIEIENFARQVAEHINLGRTRSEYQKLFVFAPSRFGGMLTKHFDKHTRNLITAQIEKDYTRVQENELIPLLRKHIQAA